MVLTAIGLIALCAVVGLAADIGYFFDYRRRMQTGVDAAALAGAEQLRRGGTTNMASAAQAAAATDGFTDGTDGTQVAVYNPPLSGYYAGNPSYVEAIITQTRPTLFMGILGLQSAKVSTRAVAGTQDSPNCVYTLSPTGGLSLGGSKATLSAACGIVVNSSAAGALDAGAGTVFGTSVAITGTYSGSCNTQDPAGCRTGVPGEPDPLATLADPQFSGCDFGTSNSPVKINGGVATLNPGVYCGGIAITAGATVTFAPGVYILNGGGLSVQGNSTIQGMGVTFYNTAGGLYNFAPVNIAGGTLGFLSAPTSGPMEGMLFFQNRTIVPQSGKGTNVIAGSSNLNFSGAFYFPTTALTFTGGGQVAINYGILVASSITVSGNTTLSADYSSLPDGNLIKKVTLAE